MRARLFSSARVSLACLAAACLTLPVLAAGPTTLGTGVTLDKVTPIADLIERPATLEGQTVRVEGVVTAVCTHMGCWMALAPESATANGQKPDGKQTVRLKVDDGVIVFPVSAKGRRAVAQGVVERVGAGDAEGQEAAAEQAKQEAAHAPGAKNAKKPAAAEAWHIKATGAIIE
jgi:hypothetical protein